jgi:hypothetical protein
MSIPAHRCIPCSFLLERGGINSESSPALRAPHGRRIHHASPVSGTSVGVAVAHRRSWLCARPCPAGRGFPPVRPSSGRPTAVGFAVSRSRGGRAHYACIPSCQPESPTGCLSGNSEGNASSTRLRKSRAPPRHPQQDHPTDTVRRKVSGALGRPKRPWPIDSGTQ